MTKKTSPFWWIGAGVAFVIGVFGTKKSKAAVTLDTNLPLGPSVSQDVLAREEIARRAEAELRRWEGLTETSPEVEEALTDYWRLALRGTHPEKRYGKKWKTEKPWSAAFIAWVANQVRPDSLKRTASHWVYTKAASQARQGYVAMSPFDPKATPLQRGDIVVSNRSGKTRTFSDLGRYNFSPAHGDIVTSTHPHDGTASAVGGNLSHTVRRRTVLLNSKGQPTQVDNGNTVFAVLRYRAGAP